MNNLTLREIAELIGIAAIVASLVFVGVQVRQSQEIALAETAFSVMNSNIEMNNQLNEHADVWVKGSAGEELSEKEGFVFTNLIRNLNQQAFFSYSNWSRFGAPSANIPIHNFAELLHHNPGAREAWVALKSEQDPYFTLRSEPLSSDDFDGRVREILELQDAL